MTGQNGSVQMVRTKWYGQNGIRTKWYWRKWYGQNAGLLIAVAPRYRYCSGATFTVAIAVAPLLLAESSADSSAATFLAVFLALLATATFKKEN